MLFRDVPHLTLNIALQCITVLTAHSTIPGQNVDSMIFKEVMHELARKLGHLGKDFSDT